MKGYPKHIATKNDLMIALNINPQRTKALLQNAIDGREGWYTVGPVVGEGIVDNTHRVKDYGEESPDLYQEQFGPIPGNFLDRLNMSVEEAQAIIGEM